MLRQHAVKLLVVGGFYAAITQDPPLCHWQIQILASLNGSLRCHWPWIITKLSPAPHMPMPVAYAVQRQYQQRVRPEVQTPSGRRTL